MATGGRRRGRVLIFVAIILILLVALAWAVTRFLNPPLQPSQPAQSQVNLTPTVPAVEMENIVISTQPIKRGATITDDVITTISFPRSEMVEGAFITKKDDVVGKRAKIDMEARIPINPNMLVDPTMKNSPAAFQIPRGQVAISVPISNLSSVSYGLQSGDHVNVIVTLLMVDLDTEFQTKLPNLTGVVTAPGTVKDGPSTVTVSIAAGTSKVGRTEMDSTLGQPIYLQPSEAQRPRLVSQTLIQDAVVLQTGNFAQPSQQTQQTTAQQQPTAAPGAQQATATPPPPVVYPETITLIVNPQDAVTLNYLIIAGGKLNMVMRSAGDDQRIATEAVTLQFVLDQYNIPNPAKLPFGLEPSVGSIPSVVQPFPSSGTPQPAVATQAP